MENEDLATVNYKDLLFKIFWTGVAAMVGALGATIADISTWWAVPATMLVTWVLALARQKTGVTPPSLPTLRKSRWFG